MYCYCQYLVVATTQGLTIPRFQPGQSISSSQQRLRSSRIEPHILFKISDAITWLHTVGLIEDKIYEILKKYIEEESQPSQTTPS
jgi:DNA-binding transcriptional regulator YhcF (GntR family)